MRTRRTGAALLGVATVLLLAACGSAADSVADRVEGGFPGHLTEDERSALPWEQPSALWIEEGTRFALVTWGSGSCPRIVTAIDGAGPSSVALTLEPSPQDICTADMAPTTHELTLPESVTARPVTVTLTYTDWPETDVLRLE